MAEGAAANTFSSSRLWLVVALAIIASLFTLQSFRKVGTGPWGVDGSYYMQVARHVADGDGLLTSVCLYDQGLRTLPAHTNIYPLWPLLLGNASRVLRLETAATLLPRFFFIADLLLLYVLAARMASPVVACAAILLLGLTPSFFSATCYPYTEGLALFCAFAALLVLRANCAWCGVFAGLAFLTRSQMLLLAVSIGFLLVIAAARRRSPWTAVALFTAAFTVTVLPWVIHLASFIRPFTPAALISMHSETPGLPVFDQHVAASNYIVDRLGGLAVMFDPRSEFSFVQSFGLAALLVPIGFAYAAWRRRWTGGFTGAAVAVAGLFLCAVLLDAHNRFFLEWLFGYRHGLPFILLLVAAMAQLTGRYARVAVIVLVLVSVITNVPRVVAFASAPAEDWPTRGEKSVAEWLRANDPRAIVLTTNAQVLSVISRANFRWTTCEQSPQDVERVLSLVRTDYVLVYEAEQRCPFAAGLEKAVSPVSAFGDAPNRIMLLKVRH